MTISRVFCVRTVAVTLLLLAAAGTLFLSQASADMLGLVRSPRGGLFCNGPCGVGQLCCSDTTAPLQ